jgi:IS5 family transposase
MARPTAQQMSFADLELLRQGVRLEPLLQAICDLLDKQPALIERVRRDLVRGLKRPAKGRRGLTAPQVLRALVLMRLKNWDYRELRERIADGITLRAFTDFYCEKVPKHDAFNRSFNRLTPATLKAVNDLVVEAAVQLGLEDGSKLRVDTTVVETDIHHPTDNTLLWDVVRVLTRLLHRLAKALELRRIEGFRDRRRAAHRRMYEIQRMTTRQRQGKGSRQTATYRALIGIAEDVVTAARTALDDTAAMRGQEPLTALKTAALRDEIAHYCDLGTRVIEQTRRRVLDGEQVPTSEKIYSIFEPHTDLIKRGKVRTPVEFGHKVFLAESAKGLITQYDVLKGNPVDEVHVAPRHRRTFRRAPQLYGADRGFFSERNETVCVHGGVATVSIPQRGGSKTPQRRDYERSAAFKQGQRFRAGIEGRISVLMRGRGMKRCRAEGAERFALFVAAAVLANNLMILGALLTKRSRRRRKTNRPILS